MQPPLGQITFQAQRGLFRGGRRWRKVGEGQRGLEIGRELQGSEFVGFDESAEDGAKLVNCQGEGVRWLRPLIGMGFRSWSFRRRRARQTLAGAAEQRGWDRGAPATRRKRGWPA